MKCPNCGQWNRASFPRCFRCGTELTPEPHQAGKAPEIPADGPGKVYIQINEAGRATSAIDDRDQLARDMENLLERKQRGEAQHRRLRENSARQGFVPSARAAQTLTGRKTFPLPQQTSFVKDGVSVEGNVRPDAIPVVSRRVIGYDETAAPEPGMNVPEKRRNRRGNHGLRIYRHGFLRRFGKLLAVILVLTALGLIAYDKGIKPYLEQQKAQSLQERTDITPSILNEWPAHIIRIPGEEGQVYWITELKTSYPVSGGYATIEVADYKWYETLENIDQETVTATITPYLKTAAGEQKRMQQITFEVDVPESTLELVTPSTYTTSTYRQLYEIQFRVAKNSTVTINGKDYTPLVNTDGLLTYQAPIDDIGDNNFVVTTRAQYCREKTATITIYRPVQDIRLDLAADIATRYSPARVQNEATGEWYEPHMKVNCTTLTWATITVESPYMNLDTTELATKGTFSFEAVFDKIGINTIKIRASAPGYQDSYVEHEVYYVPVADIYTRKAWSMKDQYNDYLNKSDVRIANTQIYQCDGTITAILSTNPQIAVMELTGSVSRAITLTNNTYDTWQVGSVYKIFGDAYGLYNGTPWLNARYSYIQTKKEE